MKSHFFSKNCHTSWRWVSKYNDIGIFHQILQKMIDLWPSHRTNETTVHCCNGCAAFCPPGARGVASSSSPCLVFVVSLLGFQLSTVFWSTLPRDLIVVGALVRLIRSFFVGPTARRKTPWLHLFFFFFCFRLRYGTHRVSQKVWVYFHYITCISRLVQKKILFWNIRFLHQKQIS